MSDYDRDIALQTQRDGIRDEGGGHPRTVDPEPTPSPAAKAIDQWADAWRQRNAFHLSDDADCSTPDSNDSAGAVFLYSVRDATLEAIEQRADEVATAEDLERLIDTADDNGAIHQIADDAPDVYTHTRWAEFTDLGAYQEDPSDLGVSADDMTAAAGVCLYMIAERLANAILADLKEYAADVEDEDEDEDEDDEAPE